MRHDRLFQLLYCLLEKGSATAPTLAAEMEVSIRTVYRDVEALSKAGVPIYAAAGRGGGISLSPGYALNKALFSAEEQDQILFAIQTLKAADQRVEALLSKLGGIFRRQSAGWIEVDFSRWGLKKADGVRFEQVRNAILNREVLEITYCGASGGTSERRIEPFKLIFKEKNWYLQAFCLCAKDYRLFKINRILSLKPTGAHFEDSFEEAPPLEQEEAQMPDLVNLRLRFSERAAFRVYDEMDHGSIERQQDGSLMVETCFPPGEWIISYLMSFGTDLEILEPEFLRGAVAEKAGKICAHYKT